MSDAQRTSNSHILLGFSLAEAPPLWESAVFLPPSDTQILLSLPWSQSLKWETTCIAAIYSN